MSEGDFSEVHSDCQREQEIDDRRNAADAILAAIWKWQRAEIEYETMERVIRKIVSQC